MKCSVSFEIDGEARGVDWIAPAPSADVFWLAWPWTTRNVTHVLTEGRLEVA